MADNETFTQVQRPARFKANGEPYPLCPCGEYQATSPVWRGWRGCPCGGAAGEITRTGTSHWRLFDRRLVDERRNARRDRQDTAVADRVRDLIKEHPTRR